MSQEFNSSETHMRCAVMRKSELPIYRKNVFVINKYISLLKKQPVRLDCFIVPTVHNHTVNMISL